MNIALFTDTFYPRYDGTQKVVESLAREYSLLGHRVVVVAPDYGRVNVEDSEKGYEVVRLKSKPSGGGHYRVSRFGHLGKKIKNKFDTLGFVPDVVHSFSPNEVGYAGIKYAKKNQIKSIITIDTKFSFVFHRDIPFSRKNLLHRVIFRIVLHINTIPESIKKADILTVVSKGTYKNEIEGEYKIKRDFVCVRNGIDTIKNKIDKLDFSNYFYLCYAGRIDVVKNLDFSFLVCRELKNRGIPFEFYILGSGSYENYFKKQAIKLGIKDNVNFLGRQDYGALLSYYSKSDALLFPSLYDTDGLVVKDAKACNCPSLVIKYSCAGEQVEDGVDGFLIENNVDKFVDKIEELFLLKKNNFNEYLKWRNSVSLRQNPNWNQIALEYICIYNKNCN